ncbi:MAG: serine/threonine protein kinase [Polyangiaceae bacterium]|nr:serine/threonine protein kinase [Polyangiaceae bacterium]
MVADDEPLSTALGAFETLAPLGSGGMGAAFLARAVGPGGFERLVVLKRLHAHLLDNPQSLQRFRDEANLAAHVRHANVVSTLLVGEDDIGHFLVLDYVEGASVEELVDRAALRQQRLEPPIVLRLGLDALAGLHAIHSARDNSGRPLEILHRDISVQNLLVGVDGVTRVADFGIAKSALGAALTDRNYLVGKLAYVPPEYLRREAVGREFDIYSLGVSLWAALVGSTPWEDADEATMVTRCIVDGVPRLSTVLEIPPQIDALIASACHPDRTERFQSAQEMSDAIERIGRETGWLATHREVAAVVDSLCRVDLDRRRQHVAELLEHRATRGATAHEPLLLSTRKPLARSPARAVARSATRETLPLPLAPRRTGWVIAGLAVAAVAGALSVSAWLRRAPRADASQVAEASPTASASLAPESPREVATAEPAADAAPTALSAPPAGAAARRPAPRPTPAVTPTTTPPPPVPAPPAGGGITTSNPYRGTPPEQ